MVVSGLIWRQTVGHSDSFSERFFIYNLQVSAYIDAFNMSQSSTFQSCRDNFLSSWVEPELYKQQIKCLVQGHNTVTPTAVSLELATILFPV